MATLTIATRKSALALWQARYIKDKLEGLYPDLRAILLPITSRGDKILDVPLTKMGGKGLFVKELEHALLSQKADIAVHSMKDVPMEFPDGLGLNVICEREDPRDAFISSQFSSFNDLPQGAKVGTSSLRRQCQLLAVRPDLDIQFLRGNVNTRLARLDNGDYHAIILAAAGLKRLAMAERITQYLSPELCLPAAGQGAVGIECRLDDDQTCKLLAPLAHVSTSYCVSAERALIRRLEGSCQVPIASYAVIQDDHQLCLRGLVGEPKGGRLIKKEMCGSLAKTESLGVTLAEQLLAAGAGDILAAVYAEHG